MQTTETKQTPEKKFKAGAISATVWKNDGQKGSYKSVQLTRSFRDKAEKWKTTSSFRVTDLPKVALVANKAYEYLVINDGKQADSHDVEEIEDLL
ncbi:MAG: hypothetical protein EPN86_01295 [Nanoarchaeota archaeon]|nr:MAG: hypothetical protein EPN86_01295 [Nanoarchaeota archaeon]